MSSNFRDHKYVLLWKLKFFQEIPPTPHLVIWLDREVCLIPWLSLRKAGYSKPAILFTSHLHPVVSDSLRPQGRQHIRLSVLHSLLEFAQIHVHWVGDAIQPSHSLSPSSPAFSHSQHQGLLQWPFTLGGQTLIDQTYFAFYYLSSKHTKDTIEFFS